MTKPLPKSIEATLTWEEAQRDWLAGKGQFTVPQPTNDPLPKLTRCALEIIETTHTLSYVERAVPTGEIIGTGVLAVNERDQAA
jgi:hypothetical protein